MNVEHPTSNEKQNQKIFPLLTGERAKVRFWPFDIWSLFGIWFLGFVIYIAIVTNISKRHRLS